MCVDVHASSKIRGVKNLSDIYYKNIDGFTKWVAVLEKNKEEADYIKNFEGCEGTLERKCQFATWYLKLTTEANQDYISDIYRIHHEVNKFIYKKDDINWDKDDYWASPFEFFQHSGDCEDFAITKYFLLKDIGIDKSKMKIMVLYDSKQQETHSVLLILLHQSWYILDNRNNDIIGLDQAPLHYIPLYSINENGWWYYSIPDYILSKS